MKEEWKPLIYKGENLGERFLLSSQGEVYSKVSNRTLKTTKNKSTGYECIVVSVGGRKNKKMIKIHIAVACTFLGNWNENLVVNHIDGDKTNNSAKNLECITQKENTLHALKNGLLKNNQKVKCLNNGMVFNSIKEAGRWCGMAKDATSLKEYFRNKNRIYAGKDPVTGEKLKWELVV